MTRYVPGPGIRTRPVIAVPWMSAADLGEESGVSKEAIIDEIRRGCITAGRAMRHGHWMYAVPLLEATRWQMAYVPKIMDHSVHREVPQVIARSIAEREAAIARAREELEAAHQRLSDYGRTA